MERINTIEISEGRDNCNLPEAVTIKVLQDSIASKALFILIATWSIYKIMKGSLRFGEAVYTKAQLEGIGLTDEIFKKIFKPYGGGEEVFTFRDNDPERLNTNEQLPEAAQSKLREYLTAPDVHMNTEGEGVRNKKKSLCMVEGEIGLLTVALSSLYETKDWRYPLFEGFIALNTLYALLESYSPQQLTKFNKTFVDPKIIITSIAMATFLIMSLTGSFNNVQEAILPLGLTTISAALGLDAKWEKTFLSLIVIGSGLSAASAGIDSYNHLSKEGLSLGTINSTAFTILDGILTLFMAQKLLEALRKKIQE